jgi:enoyl reductase-like protein
MEGGSRLPAHDAGGQHPEGSHVIVAKKAATEPEVKKLLVNTPGIESKLEWEMSYTGIVGGVVTVTSELGETF